MLSYSDIEDGMRRSSSLRAQKPSVTTITGVHSYDILANPLYDF